MEDGEIESKQSNKPLWMISVGHGFTHWYPATFYLILPLLGNELGLSYTEIGFLLTFQAIISSIINIPGGIVSDLIHRKGVLMTIALFWVGFPYFLMGFSSSYWVILLCISVVGIGNMFWHPSAIPTLTHLYPERKGLALSIHSMGSNAGDALAPLAIGVLLTWLTWREAVIINILPGIMMAIIIFIALYDIRINPHSSRNEEEQSANQSIKAKASHFLKGFKKLFTNKSMILLSSSSAFRAMAQNGLITFLPLYLANDLGLSMFWVGVSLSIMQGAGFIATPVAGHYSDKIGRKKIIIFSMAMMIMTLLVVVIIRNPSLFIFGVAVLGFFLYSMRPVIQAWLLESTPKEMGGTSISILFTVQSIGASVFPLIGGVIADVFGIFTVFYLVILVMLLANIFIFFIQEGNHKSQFHQSGG